MSEQLPPNAEEHDRAAQPVDREEPPHLPFPVVAIGASAGGLDAYTEFLKATPADSGMAFVLIQHLPPDRESMLVDILSRHTKMRVAQIVDAMPVEPNHVYIIRPGYSITIKDGKLHVGEKLHKPDNNRPIDDFFRSLAEEQRERAICIILSGMGSNGSAGAQAIKAVGGLCVAQEPETAEYPSMPRHLVESGYADYILPPKDMPAVLLAYAGHPYASGKERTAAQVKRDEGYFREILAILRTRTKQEFGSYKRPTLMRRVQRRMGLARMTKMGEYAKMLRQSPSEVTALADDLLIHVTGFFRDPEAWETLRTRVIVPLIASREPDASIRCWVSACSSGEEAYSLGMLLVEEAERVGKPLDIKIFATDMADRTLQNARAGTYPGGIETEMPPARLERFFSREDAVYRVRSDLRERVVFAPQNVLQDPPFSRIDIVTCRNLLIYLEPEAQQKLLSLLHFGLREGGALFLGTSETVAGSEEMFDPVDRKWRIYRRVGPTRHGRVEFPLPKMLLDTENGDRPGAAGERRIGPRPSVGQLTHKALLERHTPAAVTVDRDHRVVFYHGQTAMYLEQPMGEPTRDLFALVREPVRGAVRAALHRAISEGAPASSADAWQEDAGGNRRRIVVTASPLDLKSAPDYYVISFEVTREVPAAAAAEANAPQGTTEGELRAELSRVRDELQSALEEMQTANEELKASNEEITSVNEELQSSNEELETSKEEMQSLNEELSTVNAQLQAKMEELQVTSNDLSSLLASTNIAVLFLDTQFRIRRFTPAVRHLLELINTDIGRPLNDLARKFDDPELNDHVAMVLERLIPIERQIESREGRVYLRRILPYRTTDNHIDGVVIAFVDISERKRAEESDRETQSWLAGQKEAFQAAMSGRPLAESLGVLVRTAINQTHGAARAAFFMVPPGGEGLEHIVGMPESYARATKGFAVGPESLACGLAAHNGEPAITPDVESEPRWIPWRDMAREHGYRACWSFPVQIDGGPALGTFALYFRDPREPTPRELELAAVMSHAAAIILSRNFEAAERARAEAELRTNMDELTRFNQAMVARELRMIDLKKEVNALREQVGDERRYPLDFENEEDGHG